MSQVVLITGCSTGIGRDLAGRLTQAGYSVIATARQFESLADLPAALKLALDVTQPTSIAQALECTLARFDRLDVLVNNAGYARVGALEEVPLDSVQQMFDVNVFGVLRMIQAVVPHMRRQGGGRIINVGSIAGKLATPVNGPYSATKFALEALSDALRLELEPFGIRVSLIEPGAIKTRFDQTVNALAQATLSAADSPYRVLYREYQQSSDGMRRNEPGPEVVSRVIQQAIEASAPKARYRAGVPFGAALVMGLGNTAWDKVCRQMYKGWVSKTWMKKS